MNPQSDSGRGNDRALTRRGYLAAAGVGLAGAGLAGTAAGQTGTGNGTATGTNETSPTGDGNNRYTRRVVIPEDERFEDYNQDLFLHVIESTDVTLDIKEFERCNFANWSPDSTTAYRTQLIDRLRGDPQPVETNAFVNETGTVPLESGSLYIINNSKQCPGRYIGLEVEWLSGYTPSGDETEAQTPAGTTQSNGDGAGFGALGALGALGAGALARAWRRD